MILNSQFFRVTCLLLSLFMIGLVCEAYYYEFWSVNFSKYCSNIVGRGESLSLPSSRSDGVYRQTAFEESVSKFILKT